MYLYHIMLLRISLCYNMIKLNVVPPGFSQYKNGKESWTMCDDSNPELRICALLLSWLRISSLKLTGQLRFSTEELNGNGPCKLGFGRPKSKQPNPEAISDNLLSSHAIFMKDMENVHCHPQAVATDAFWLTYTLPYVYRGWLLEYGCQGTSLWSRWLPFRFFLSCTFRHSSQRPHRQTDFDDVSCERPLLMLQRCLSCLLVHHFYSTVRNVYFGTYLLEIFCLEVNILISFKLYHIDFNLMYGWIPLEEL